MFPKAGKTRNREKQAGHQQETNGPPEADRIGKVTEKLPGGTQDARKGSEIVPYCKTDVFRHSFFNMPIKNQI